MYGVWCVVHHSAWCMVYGAWCTMVPGVWRMAYGAWCPAQGPGKPQSSCYGSYHATQHTAVSTDGNITQKGSLTSFLDANPVVDHSGKCCTQEQGLACTFQHCTSHTLQPHSFKATRVFLSRQLLYLLQHLYRALSHHGIPRLSPEALPPARPCSNHN